MPTSRAAASAMPSWPLPPSITIRSGSFHATSSSPPSACFARRNRRDSTSYIDAKSSFFRSLRPPPAAGARTLYVR